LSIGSLLLCEFKNILSSPSDLTCKESAHFGGEDQGIPLGGLSSGLFFYTSKNWDGKYRNYYMRYKRYFSLFVKTRNHSVNKIKVKAGKDRYESEFKA